MASVAMLPVFRDNDDNAKSTGEDSDNHHTERKRPHSSSDSDDKDRERGRRRRDEDRRQRRRRSHDRDYRSERGYERGPRYWGSRTPSPDGRRRSNGRNDDHQRDHHRGGDYDDRKRSDKDLYWNKYSSRGVRNRRDDKDTQKRKDVEKEDRVLGTKHAEDDETLSSKNTPYSEKNKAKQDGAEALTLRTGGAYIPPAKLRMMQQQLTDKNSIAFQRFAWEALKKSLNGLINKVNVSNIGIIVRELFKENIIRGRGLFARSVMQAQAASPTFTHVYASLVAIVNSKFPQIGELILTRLIVQFRRGFRRNDKNICLSSTRFMAHLVNQQVAHEIVALQVLTLLLENVTNHSVEVAIGFLKECGAKLTEVTPRGINAVFDRLRSILHDGQVDDRTRYMIEVMFAVRKDGFKDHPIFAEKLDLVQEEEQFTHSMQLQEATNGEDILNVFKHDPNYEENEEKYKTIRSEILEEGSSDESDGSGGSGSESEEANEDEEGGGQDIIDNTETNLVSLRRTIYLTIQSSMDFQECAHKLLKMELKPSQEPELCHMILDCCAQQRTYEKFYGLLAQRFCQLNKSYVEPFEAIFRDSYETIHRLETNKLRNVAKLFAHLLYTDAISWAVLGHIKLNEDDTTSSSRIFIKILFQELAEYLGLPKLNERVKDPTLQEAFSQLFPRDHPPNTRFAINFFTSIGLGGLTDELREHLKSQPKVNVLSTPPTEIAPPSSESSKDESSSSDSDSGSSSSSSSSSSNSSSNSEERKRKRGRHSKKKASRENLSKVKSTKNTKTSKKSHHRRS